MIVTTVKEFQEFRAVADKYLTVDVNEATGKRSWNPAATKFDHAYKRTLERSGFEKTIREAIEDINIEHASPKMVSQIVNGKTELVRNPHIVATIGDFDYTKEDAKKRLDAIRRLDELAVELDPYFATEYPTRAIDDADWDVLRKFIINDETVLPE